MALLSPDLVLRGAADVLVPTQGSRIEFSIRLCPDSGEQSRFILWMAGRSKEACRSAQALLRLWNGEEAQAGARISPDATLTQGFGVCVEANRIEYRYYRHVAGAAAWPDGIVAWKWTRDAPARMCRYVFHFLPETANGLKPADAVHPAFKPAFLALGNDPRALATSGFWLRHDANGIIDQVDMVFPWNPTVQDVLDLAGLSERCGSRACRCRCRSLSIRHLAAGLDGTLTAYASTKLVGRWPKNEVELQSRVRRGAARTRS